ncbi:MAG TPA: RluA family pseudouridine synthase [Methylomirabilota bacterium]|jgi:23S rRNA pseudouridine1911/1915/1917 synthase|nr:RluA family pseudouridine synthase [Methylomirabilota bacterium]
MTAGAAAALPERLFSGTVAAPESGSRLDVWLNGRLPDLSRTRIKALVESGQVLIDGRRVKVAHRVRTGERVDARVPPPPAEELPAEAIPLQIVFEDDDVLVVDKPAGMVTHPGAGRSTGTLAAAALAHAPEIAGVGGPRRPGIVHRLDKGTSGLIVLAKTRQAYEALTAQLARRNVTRRYLCLVHGEVKPGSGVIDKPIARDERSRVRMAVARAGKGKRAVTRFRVVERLPGVTVVECRLETGRTHQIRVHLASLGHPLLGDETYGGRRRERGEPALAALVDRLGGVALHAAGLEFTHPVTGKPLQFSSPVPYRIESLVSHLRSAPR